MSRCLGGKIRAHLAGIAQADFWDVTVIHRVSAHNSPELHLYQHTRQIKSEKVLCFIPRPAEKNKKSNVFCHHKVKCVTSLPIHS